MYEPIKPNTERPRIRTEREYREWQLALWSTAPGHRSNTNPGFVARLSNTLRRIAAL